ncbi:MAG: PilT/PilU family type 4a pilus ATPase [Candidatus Eremiobacteraeota bacterium]|nr:PilT/PilU family type 4a pilus ATPase [Candidatus Eremiobacteraeota bacterium]
MSNSLIPIQLAELLRLARAKNASDLHVAPGLSPVVRIDGALESVAGVITQHQCELMARELLKNEGRNSFGDLGDASVAHRDPQFGSFRIHAYRTGRGTALAIRLLAQHIPTLDSLHLPEVVASFAQRRSGLILFAGPTGSGKTTALAALIDRINRKEAKHVITIEDPIEYAYESQKSVVTQREVGRDVRDFASALSGALRADPDVILVGELRDAPTMRAALTAAETGHLVFSTLHTGDSSQTIDRMIDAFPSEAQQQVRVQISHTLQAVVCLRLVPRSAGAGRRAAAEILIASDAVRNLIREEKTHQIRDVIATGRQAGMQTLESHLSELVMRRDVTLQAARAATDRPGDVRALERAAI